MLKCDRLASDKLFVASIWGDEGPSVLWDMITLWLSYAKISFRLAIMPEKCSCPAQTACHVLPPFRM